MTQQAAGFADVMKYTKSEAISTYSTHGTPTAESRYALADMQGESWNGIQDAYTDTEKTAKPITVDELTWPLDTATNVTVW